MCVPDPVTGTPPGPCTMALTSWICNSNLSISNKKVLTSNSSIQCSVGGKISPLSLTLNSITVDTSVSNIDILINDISLSDSDINKKDEKTKNTGSITNDDKTEISEKEAITEIKEDENQINENVKYAICNYKDCEEAKDCFYLKASCDILTPPKSEDSLGEQMINNDSKAFFEEESNLRFTVLECVDITRARHHIICGNECYGRNREVLKLGNFFGYDVNIAENGILLPTLANGYNGLSKKDVSFCAMDKTKKEWHQGPHNFDVEIQSSVQVLLKEPNFKSYERKVQELLYSRILYKYKKSANNKECPKKIKEKDPKRFEKDMNKGVSSYVRNKLNSFSASPKKAEFYVSILSFYYAFYDKLKGHESEIGL